MSATSKTDWFWSDWLGDQAVRRLTPAERGVWIDLLGLAAVGHPVGYVCDDNGRPLPLSEIARITNAGSVDEVAKLIDGILEKGAASRDRAGRLFNRRMVRETERAARQAALAAKRAKAGALGAAQTNSKYFGFQKFSTLPQQLPRQLPQHVPRQTLVASPKENKSNLETPSLGAARATPAEKPQSKDKLAGSLATAHPTGALARQPEAEQDQQEKPWQGKPVAALTRDELDAYLADKRARANGTTEH